MSVRLTRRLAFLLVLASLLLITCSYIRPKVFCTRGNNSSSYPLVCVDENTLTANPRIAKVYEFQPDKTNRPSQRPVTIRWFAHTDVPLEIRFQKASCVGLVTCDGHGACTATTLPLAGQASRTCTYNMFVGAQKDEDADIVITPCCS